MRDALKRAARTYVQSVVGMIPGLWALSGIAAKQFPGVSDLAAIGKIGMAALIGGLPALVSFLQNALEDKGAIPAVGKSHEPVGDEPLG